TEKIIFEDEAFYSEAEGRYIKADGLYSQAAEAVTKAENDNVLIKRLMDFEEEKRSLLDKKPLMDALSLSLERAENARRVKPSEEMLESRLASLKDLEAKLKLCEEEEKKGEADLASAEERYKKALLRVPEAEELKAAALLIEGDRDKYALRDELSLVAEECVKKLDVLRKSEEEHAKKAQALRERISALKRRSEELKEKPEEKHILDKKYDAFMTLKQEAKLYSERYIKAYRERKAALGVRQDEYKTADAAYDEALGRRRTGEKILDSCRAGLLARELSDGCPCPVCGSTHHPAPACLTKDSVSEEDVKKLLDAEEKARQERENASRAAAEASSEFGSAEEYLRSGLSVLLKKEPFAYDTDGKSATELISAFEGQYSALGDYERKLTDELSALSALCDELEGCRKALASAAGAETEALQDKGREIASQKTEAELNLREARAKLEAFSALPYTCLKEADEALEALGKTTDEINGETEKSAALKNDKEKALSEIRGRIASLKDSRIAAEEESERAGVLFNESVKASGFADADAYRACLISEEEAVRLKTETEEYRSSLGSVEARLDEARKNAVGKAPADIDALIAVREERRGEREAVAEEKNSISARCSENKRRLSSMRDKQGEYASESKLTAIYERLYRLTSGQTGNGRITLEQYVQASGFDRIINAANKRLLPMSDNQYELRRQEGSIGKQSGNFLDLEVVDNWTGHTRPVGNLSGGESFKASLSLALGLAATASGRL
ncbi:MAG: hypothetical protein MJ067_06335, partial [Oscillospiraceae bacterium]|nr:hypothetical protein [Oscillospiraceae bacterium]